jgi:hypothetical protein
MFPPCSMPSFSTIYSLSWRLWGLTVCLYAITMVRRYILRRIFEAWSTRQERLLLTSTPLPHPPAPEQAAERPRDPSLQGARDGEGGGVEHSPV